MGEKAPPVAEELLDWVVEDIPVWENGLVASLDKELPPVCEISLGRFGVENAVCVTDEFGGKGEKPPVCVPGLSVPVGKAPFVVGCWGPKEI